MRLFLLGFLFLSASVGFASDLSVKIQCATEGPIYDGTLRFPADIQDWTRERDCAQGERFNTSFLRYEGEVHLKFNGQDYQMVSPMSLWLRTQTCDPKSFSDYIEGWTPTVDSNFVESVSGFKVTVAVDLSKVASGALTGSVLSNNGLCEFRAHK